LISNDFEHAQDPLPPPSRSQRYYIPPHISFNCQRTSSAQSFRNK